MCLFSFLTLNFKICFSSCCIVFMSKFQMHLNACSHSHLYFFSSDNGEDIQVLHYEEGQKYEPHYDYFVDKVNIVRGGHRVATVLMYLSDVGKGGETVFPKAEVSLVITSSKYCTNSFSEYWLYVCVY